jgi:CheY-like chemotaxis protein
MRHENASVALDGVRVLVVEDELDSRELMKAVLVGCGATVEAVETVDAALAAFSARPPDVIVSDIGLPGEDGYSFIERVRMLDPEVGGRVPAIALTAYVRPDDRSRALAAGFGAHLSKPIGPMELAAAVSRAVSGDRREHRRENDEA